MPSLEYETIFNKFLGKVTDYTIASMDDESSNEIMTEYLLSALALPEVENLFTELTVDEDMQEISFELKRSKGESADTRFVTEIILIAMQIAWIEPQVYSHQVTIQILGGKEEKFYSQSAALEQLKALLEESRIRLKKRIRDHNYYNLKIKESV